VTSVQTAPKVLLIDYKAAFTAMAPRLMEIVRDMPRRGAFIIQKDLGDFEVHLADHLRAGAVAMCDPAVGLAGGRWIGTGAECQDAKGMSLGPVASAELVRPTAGPPSLTPIPDPSNLRHRMRIPSFRQPQF
jgi:hypothetical protein